MKNTTTQNNKLLFGYPMLWISLTSLVSLAVALFILSPVFLLYFFDHISTEVTAWAALGVIVSAAIFGNFLLFLIKRNDRNASHYYDVPNGSDPSLDRF